MREKMPLFIGTNFVVYTNFSISISDRSQEMRNSLYAQRDTRRVPTNGKKGKGVKPYLNPAYSLNFYAGLLILCDQCGERA